MTQLGIVVPELYHINSFWQSFNTQLAGLRGISYKVYTEAEKSPDAHTERGNWYDPMHITRLVGVRNRLINDAINDGAELIYMIDDDLYLAPDTLNKLVTYMLGQPADVPLVVGAASYSIEHNKLMLCDYTMTRPERKLPAKDFYELPPDQFVDQNWLMRTSDLKKYFPGRVYIPDHIWETLEFCRIIHGMGWRQVLYTGQLALCDVDIIYDPAIEKKPEDVTYWEEYSQSYTSIDVNGKIVLDIGGDVGSSAIWFLRQGASKVIVYTLDEPVLFDSRIEYHGAWNGEYVPADVLKIDCEGCECYLSPDLIEKYDHYYIATHVFAPCFDNITEYLRGKAKVVYTTSDHIEIMYAK